MKKVKPKNRFGGFLCKNIFSVLSFFLIIFSSVFFQHNILDIVTPIVIYFEKKILLYKELCWYFFTQKYEIRIAMAEN